MNKIVSLLLLLFINASCVFADEFRYEYAEFEAGALGGYLLKLPSDKINGFSKRKLIKKLWNKDIPGADTNDVIQVMGEEGWEMFTSRTNSLNGINTIYMFRRKLNIPPHKSIQ